MKRRTGSRLGSSTGRAADRVRSAEVPVWRFDGSMWTCIAHEKRVCAPCRKAAKIPWRRGKTGDVYPPVP